MAKFTYNNIKNISLGYISSKLNFKYYFKVSFKNKINSYSKFYSINKLAHKIKKLIKNYY